MDLKQQIDKARMPRHIAIIMDGNGRWAKKQGLARVFGHKRGVETVHNITVAATELGIEYLTLYTFSTENWNRPKEEIDALMNLLVDTIVKETPTLMDNNVRLLTIGDLNRLPEAARRKFMGCVEQTAGNTGLSMVIALSYSARWEIINAMQTAVRRAQAGELRAEDVNEQLVSSLMTTANMPDPDLLIRTSGELRISNFLLWQLAYSELYFTECLWPDFTPEELYRAILDYQNRERRFGKTSEQIEK
ncbi:MAG: isoprenyl transferase [Paludibacteraceae bacterium]|jgi:undecaprenyl diphosphate synthase|nr:isoprenyl transferase [Paludibacteraceae bacterium]